MLDIRSDSRSQQTPALLVGESPWFERLNVDQRAAVRHPGGPLLILARAGTGKTTTLCGRVAWLVADGVAPGTDPAADVHAARSAGDVAARAGAGGDAERRSRRTGWAPSIRSPIISSAGTRRRSGCRQASACLTPETRPTCSTSCARSTDTRSVGGGSEEEHAARYLLPHGERTATAFRGARRRVPLVVGSPHHHSRISR